MIQRIQSLYMFISVVLGIVCLCLPLGAFYNMQGTHEADLYNLWIRICDTGLHIFTPWALFALMLSITSLTFIDIFLFNRRALQMRILVFCMILLVGYYMWLAFIGFIEYKGELSFTPSITAGLPFVCIVLDYLAFRGILKDEMLVRSLDRLR